MSLEIFKDIDGYKNYQVTSWGRVFNKETGRFLKPQVHDKGYLRIDLYDEDGNRKHFKIHRLVAEAFIPNTECKPLCDKPRMGYERRERRKSKSDPNDEG